VRWYALAAAWAGRERGLLLGGRPLRAGLDGNADPRVQNRRL